MTGARSGKNTKGKMEVAVRPMTEADLPAARAVFQLAFGTYLGRPEPEKLFADRDMVGCRWRVDPDAAFVAEIAGPPRKQTGAQIVGSNFAIRWGSVGFFGPLSVHPDCWGMGVAQALIEPAMECFTRWHIAHRGIFTYADSAKHLELYRRYGFWPRFQTILLGLIVDQARAGPAARFITFDDLDADGQAVFIEAAAGLTDAIYPGLDLSLEIGALAEQQKGDTVIIGPAERPDGFAICHCGAGSEAGTDTCFVKFGAVRPGPEAARHFDALLAACADLVRARGLNRIEAGMSLARRQAYGAMIDQGYRILRIGVNMHAPDEPGYHGPEIFVIDDWR